MKRRNFIINSS